MAIDGVLRWPSYYVYPHIMWLTETVFRGDSSYHPGKVNVRDFPFLLPHCIPLPTFPEPIKFWQFWRWFA